MNLGIAEIVIIIIQLALNIGIPVIIIGAGILLFRRIQALESRVEKLESSRDTSSDKTA